MLLISFIFHKSMNLHDRILKIEANVSFFKRSSRNNVPVMHVTKSVKNDLALNDHGFQHLTKRILFNLHRSLILLELLALLQFWACLLYRLQRLLNLRVDSIINHILELILSFELFIKNTKSDIFTKSQDMRLIVHDHLLFLDIDQETLLVMSFILDRRSGFVFILSWNHLIMRQKRTIDVLIYDLVNLSILAVVDRVDETDRLFDELERLLHFLIVDLVLSIDYMNELQVFLIHSLAIFQSIIWVDVSQKHFIECVVDELDINFFILALSVTQIFLFNMLVKNEAIRHLIKDPSLFL